MLVTLYPAGGLRSIRLPQNVFPECEYYKVLDMVAGVIGPGVIQSTRRRKGSKTAITQRVPKTLKSIWAQPARLAFVLVLAAIDARKVSKVVPILAPRVMAAAMPKVAFELGHLTQQVPLSDMADTISRLGKQYS